MLSHQQGFRNENTLAKSCQNPITSTWLQMQGTPWATGWELLTNPRGLKWSLWFPGWQTPSGKILWPSFLQIKHCFYPDSSTTLGESAHGFTAGEEIKRWHLLSIQDKGVPGHRQTAEMRNFWNSQYSTIQGSKIPSVCRMMGRAVLVTFNRGWARLSVVCCDRKCGTPFFLPFSCLHPS